MTGTTVSDAISSLHKTGKDAIIVHIKLYFTLKAEAIMGIFTFKKKKTTNKTYPCSAENVNADIIPESKPKYSIMRGSFSNIDSEYQVIGSVISALERTGFLLSGIQTSGEDSGHDWTVAYRKSYSSFEAFCANAMADYREACSNQQSGSPHLDWDSTSFSLTNQLLFVRLYALNDSTPRHEIYRAGWALHIPEDMADDDALIKNALDILKEYE